MIQNFLIDPTPFSCRKLPFENLVLHAGPSATPDPCLIPPNATPQCSEKCIPPAWSGSFNRSFQSPARPQAPAFTPAAAPAAAPAATTSLALQPTHPIAA